MSSASTINDLYLGAARNTYQGSRPAPEGLVSSFRSYVIETVLGSYQDTGYWDARTLEQFSEGLLSIEQLGGLDGGQVIPSRDSILQAFRWRETNAK